MKYINKFNGAMIETSSKMGGAWEPEKVSQAKPVEEVKDEAPKKKTKRTK